jgi:hypothetical protein
MTNAGHRIRPRHLTVPLALAVLVSMGATGCANLEAVRRFAVTSAETAAYEEVVRDYVDSLRRQRLYQPEAHRAELDALTRARLEQQKRLEAVQKSLVDYLAVLGDLAADSMPGVDSEVEAIKAALEGGKFIGDGDAQVRQPTATAAAALANLLGRAITDVYRQAKLKGLILEAAPHFHAAVAGLREVLDVDLRRSLHNEAAAMEKPFRAWESAALAANDPDGAAPVARLLREERLEVLHHKEARLDAYLGVLDTIAQGHAAVVKQVDTLEIADLKQKLTGYTENLKASAASIAALVDP